MNSSALVLFAHGARDPRWAEPFRRLQEMIRAQQPQRVVELAFLELMKPSLAELVGELERRGCLDVKVVPVFLGQGGHVLRDLPVLIRDLQDHHPALHISAAPAVGEDPAVLKAIADYCIGQLPAE